MKQITNIKLLFLIIPAVLLEIDLSCKNPDKQLMEFEEIQLTLDTSGHFLNSTQCFSPDSKWIVYDSRNSDDQIGSTSKIAMVNVVSGEIKILYETSNQTEYGPGVGAVTFSPVANRVLFIHGIRNADSLHSYSMTRRTGVSIDLIAPGVPLFMDARDIIPPFTSGALRGGTHAHSWTADGEWISYTYNDYILEQAAKTDTSIKNLRTIGIMVPGRNVTVPENGKENNNGEMFAMIVVEVKANPRFGSDEIEKAFDETWIGNKGYQKADGSRQHRAIAFQGNIHDKAGKVKTEIFVVDIPDDILRIAQRSNIAGSSVSMPSPPPSLQYRRISYTEKGVSNSPRHWLRSSPDGTKIAYLAEDNKGIIQLFTISPNGGIPVQLTSFEFSIQGPANFSPDGKYIAYLADNSVFMTELKTLKSFRVTPKSDEDSKPVGAVNFSYDGKLICYNRYVKNNNRKFIQIFVGKKIEASGIN